MNAMPAAPHVSYRLAPGPTGGLRLTARGVHSARVAWSSEIPSRRGEWRTDVFAVALPRDVYVLTFDVDGTWSNPDRSGLPLPSENRRLAFALSSLSLA